MKKFLRFEVSGITAFLWLAAFTLPYLDLSLLKEANAGKIVLAGLGGAVAAIPLGTLLHQSSVTILCLFNKKRILGTSTRKFHEAVSADARFSAISSSKSHAWLSVLSRSIKEKSGDTELDVDNIRQEISNRYSYIYIRFDNALFAPIIGFAGSFLTCSLIKNSSFSAVELNYSTSGVYVAAVVVAILNLAYVPQLLSEIDDLEVNLLNISENSMKQFHQ